MQMARMLPTASCKVWLKAAQTRLKKADTSSVAYRAYISLTYCCACYGLALITPVFGLCCDYAPLIHPFKLDGHPHQLSKYGVFVATVQLVMASEYGIDLRKATKCLFDILLSVSNPTLRFLIIM